MIHYKDCQIGVDLGFVRIIEIDFRYIKTTKSYIVDIFLDMNGNTYVIWYEAKTLKELKEQLHEKLAKSVLNIAIDNVNTSLFKSQLGQIIDNDLDDKFDESFESKNLFISKEEREEFAPAKIYTE